MDPMRRTSAAERRAGVPSDRDIHLVELDANRDDRGLLVAAEVGESLPFQPARAFMISDVPAGAARAQHANRTCAEVLVCAAGSCRVQVRRAGSHVEDVRLDRPDVGLYVGPGVWLECDDFGPGTVLVVFASHPYDPTDQITDLAAYLAWASPDAGP